MYRTIKAPRTTLRVNNSTQGETIETKVCRIVNNKEPIKDSADLIYTDRKAGVNPAHDPRHDRWDTAIEAMDKIAKRKALERMGTIGEQAKEGMNKENGGAEPIQATKE